RELAGARRGMPHEGSVLSDEMWPPWPGLHFGIRTRRIYHYATRETKPLNHEHIGTHHILLSMLRPEHRDDLPALSEIRREDAMGLILGVVPAGPDTICMSRPPRTERHVAMARFTIEEVYGLG